MTPLRSARLPRPLGWVLLAAAATALLGRFLQPIEIRVFDLRLGLRRSTPFPPDLVMVPIDDAAMKSLGRWPWPREKIAELVDDLGADGAKTVMLDFIFGAPTTKDADDRLSHSLGKSVLAIGYARDGDPEAGPALRNAMVSATAARARDPAARFSPANLVIPEDAFANAAKGVGHTIFSNPNLGAVRGHLPLLHIEGLEGALPSLPLVAWMMQRDWDPKSIECDGKTLTLPNGVRIPLYDGEMYLDLARDDAPPRVDVRDVLAHPGSAELKGALSGKLALVHIDSVSEPDTLMTPVSNITPGGRLLAWTIRTFESGRAPRDRFFLLDLLVCLVVALAAAIPLSRESPSRVLAFAASAVAFVAAIGVIAVAAADVFLPIVLPSAFLLLAGGLLAAHAGRVVETERRQLRALLAASHGSAPSSPAIVGPAVDGPTSDPTRKSPSGHPLATAGVLLGGQPLAQPVELGRYLVQRSLGRGGMGAIFLARDRDLDRLVALKVLEAADPEAFHRFRREAMAVARLVHPNVVQIHEVGLDATVPYLVMEYVPGGSLSEFLRHPDSPSPLPWQRATRIVTGIAHGLGAAHAAGIVHRDVKPSNLLLMSFDSDVAKIADFGIAKLSGAEALTREGSFVGTIGYMSPEQAMGLDVDARSDVYSLGVAYYRMLTGRAAFDGTTAQVLRNAVVEPVPDPRQWVEVPDAVAELLARMTAVDREHRIADGNEAARLLEKLL